MASWRDISRISETQRSGSCRRATDAGSRTLYAVGHLTLSVERREISEKKTGATRRG